MSIKLCVCIIATLPFASFAAERVFYPVRDRLQLESLNGTWDFKYTDKKVKVRGEGEGGCEGDAVKSCVVPGNWETQGISRPGYSTYIPKGTGIYRRTFNYNPYWKGRHVILRFDGVMYAYDVKVNGGEVAKDVRSAYNLHQFDITPYLKESVNELEVAVRNFGDYIGYDMCDDWSLSGIQRDVDIFTVGDDYLESVQFISKVDANGDADVELNVGVGSYGEKKVKVNAFLSDRTRRQVLAFSASSPGAVRFTGHLTAPDLWTAETPNLYWLTVELVNAKGEVMQRSEELVGIREVRVDGRHLLVNNRSVKLRGVCLNEIDPKVGRAYGVDDFRKRLALMKRCHVNFIRTAHYPFAPVFYELCNEMGFYVLDEVPYASGGRTSLGKDAALPTLRDRAVRTVLRDRNHPSVIMWSIGNENPYFDNTVGVMMDLVKELDPTRPRTLPHARQISPRKNGEQTSATWVDVGKWLESVRGRLDIASIHYADTNTVSKLMEVSGEMPVIMTEYAHAMGNGFNGFESRIAQMISDDRLLGGSIWDWNDQGIMTDERDMEYYAAHTNRWPTNEAKPRLWSSPPFVQGVWTDPRHFIDSRGSYGTDGIVYANGYPKESWELVRKLYSPVVVTLMDGKLEVENRHVFTSLRGWKLKWTGGEAWLSAEPGLRESFACDLNVPFVAVSVYDPKGERVWETSFRGNGASVAPFKTRRAAGPQNVKEFLETMHLKVGRKPGICYLCRINGRQKQLEEKDEVGGVPPERFEWKPYVVHPTVVDFAPGEDKNRYTATLRYYRGEDERSEEYFEAKVQLKANRDGAFKVRYQLAPSKAVKTWCSEIGFAFVDANATRIDWDGLGPWTSTPQKSQHSTPGVWSMAKGSLFMPGNRGDIRWALVSDGQRGIGVSKCGGDVSFEEWKGGIVMSVNCLVTGFGGKGDSGVGSGSVRGRRFSGEFVVSEVGVTAPLPAVAPDCPFFSHYGW